MEIILVVIVLGVLGYWAYSANKKRTVTSERAPEVNPSAPYKVPEPEATTPIPLVVTNSNPADNVPLVAEVTAPVEAAKPAKAPRAKKPAAAKTTATKTTATKTTKPKAPRKPKMTVVK